MKDKSFKENRLGGIDCERFIQSINSYAPYTMTAEEAQAVMDSGVEVVPLDPSVKDAAARAEANHAARAYLTSTDWYVTRMLETGTPIPPVVSARRSAAREAVADEK